MTLLILFVVAIIILQLALFVKTDRLISNLKKVLNGNFNTHTIAEYDITYINYIKGEKDKISQNIENSINTYLHKNKGAVSDFNLIKDIVERNCDTLEAEITSQTPLPLYLGLMGTVAGIILGLFAITLSGGFSNIENVIEILMSDVAIAMIASFMGIGLTTWTLWKSKQCKVIVEANKNRFYTWIQTNLLPVISKSAVSAITLLQQNLTRFNNSFIHTVDRLEERLEDVGKVYGSQIDILKKIETIDVKRMAVANVKVLAALDGSMGSLEKFSQYMANVTEYLTAVRNLNGKLDEHLERTETLGVVSDFYKQQMKEIGLRQDAIKSAVLSVDDVMKSAFATLQSNSEHGLRSMREAFVAQMSAMQDMIAKQTEQLTAQMKQMPQVVGKLDEISVIPAKLDKLINRIEKSNAGLAGQVSQSMRYLSASKGEPLGVSSNNQLQLVSTDMPWMKWSLLVVLAIIALACIANLTVNIMSFKSNDVNVELVAPASDNPLDSISIGATDNNLKKETADTILNKVSPTSSKDAPHSDEASSGQPTLNKQNGKNPSGNSVPNAVTQ